MRARRFTAGFVAFLTLIPVAVAAGADEPAETNWTSAVADATNQDLRKISSHLMRWQGLIAAGADSAELDAAIPELIFDRGMPLIEIRFRELTDETVKQVVALGFRATGVYLDYGVMTGPSDFATLSAIAALPEVAVIHPISEPIPSTGSVTSQADSSIRADLARSQFGIDGSGVVVGVLSDSFNVTLGGAVTGAGCSRVVTGMTNQASGDLPASVGLLDDYPARTDEGAAMAELIHDLAPGASLTFHTAWRSQADFASGIAELRACGADVIVDDVGYMNEPVFQDGFIAQAAQDAVSSGAVYLSSAGNGADEAIAQSYVDSNPGADDTLTTPSGNDFHDFGGGDRFASLTVRAGRSVRFALHWNEPFTGTLGPGSAVDMNLYVCSSADPASCTLSSSTDPQGCSAGSPNGDPYEFDIYTNSTGSDQTVYVAIEHRCGSENNEFRLLTSGGTNFEAGVFNDYSIYGHSAAAGVGSVAAVDYREIDSGGSFSGGSGINVESFSSLGGDIPYYFDRSGSPLPGAPSTVFHPAFAAPDHTNTTFFSSGYDPDGDGHPNFSGTSAAAPHAAAVAALILEENPLLTPTQVISVLQSSAIDIESGGVDPLSGDGLIDARDAVAAASSIDTTAPSWPGGSALSFSNITETGARVSWPSAIDNVGVAEYRVYLDGSYWGSTAATFVDLSGLAVGTSYTVKVEARDAVGNESTTGPTAELATLDTQPPGWPAGSTLTISDVGETAASASWTAATDNGSVASYKLYLNGALEAETTDTAVSLTGLTTGQTYTARVQAVDGVGNESTDGPSTTFTTIKALPPGGSFTDDNGNIHESNIEAIAAAAITRGCNPPVNDQYCPQSAVTRGQMAAFLVRALGLTSDGGGNKFVDDDRSVFEVDIAKLAAAGITKGCNPPVNNRFCPNDFVTRGQMAAFLVRALGLTSDGGGNKFVDDDRSVFEGDIAKLAAAGITKGCNPPTNNQFCPNDPVKRDQMASFLARALDLPPLAPPTVSTFGAGLWTVPVQVPPGTYRNSDSSSFCVWERLRGFSRTAADVIEDGITGEIEIVTISPTDAGFWSEDCGTWSTDLSPRTSSPTSDFGGGVFQVGSEVAPGTWRNSDSSDDCYWERLSGFGGSLGEIIVNEFSDAIQTVTISSSDVGFSSERCGTWSKVG